MSRAATIKRFVAPDEKLCNSNTAIYESQERKHNCSAEIVDQFSKCFKVQLSSNNIFSQMSIASLCKQRHLTTQFFYDLRRSLLLIWKQIDLFNLFNASFVFHVLKVYLRCVSFAFGLLLSFLVCGFLFFYRSVPVQTDILFCCILPV